MNRAYEGDETRGLVLDLEMEPVVPPKRNRLDPWEYDKEMYKKRNEIERLFRRLKGFRRIFEKPTGGWQWLIGEEWDYTNWAINLDDGVVDKDPRPNDSGDGQPIMGFGEMNLPVPFFKSRAFLSSVSVRALFNPMGRNSMKKCILP